MNQDAEQLPKIYEVNMQKLEAYLKNHNKFISDIKKNEKEVILKGEFEIEELKTSVAFDEKMTEASAELEDIYENTQEEEDNYIYQQLTLF